MTPETSARSDVSSAGNAFGADVVDLCSQAALDWINPRCSMCGVGRPVLGCLEMDNILSGLDRHHHVKQFYPRF